MAFGIPIAIWIAAGEFAFSAITQAMAPTAKTGRLAQNDFHSLQSAYDLPLPKCWGADRVAGNISWVSAVREHKYTVGENMFGGGGTDIFYYTQDVEYSFTVGEAKAFIKIWLGDKVIYDQSAAPPDAESGAYGSNLGWWGTMLGQLNLPTTPAKDRLFDSFELFLGTGTQQPSTVIAAAEGYGSVPADRGIVKIVIKNLNITLVGNALPSASAIIQFEDYTPVAGAETTAIAHATSVTTSGQATGSHALINYATTTTGQIYRFGSSSLTDNDPQINWADFVAPTLPDGATITGIYPFFTMSRLGSALLGHVYADFDNPMRGVYSEVGTAGELSRQTLYGSSVGTSLSAISGMTSRVTNNETLVTGNGYDDTTTVYDVGFEIRYTSPLVPPTGTTLGAILRDLFQSGGLTSSQYDIESSVANIPVKGFKTEQKAIRDVIRELADIYPFDGVESDGKLKIVHRARVSAATIGEDDMVLSGGAAEAYRLSEPITQENEIPMKAEVHYADIDRDFQDNMQPSKRIVEPAPTMESINVKSVSTNVVMNANEAAQAADRIMWEGWAQRYGGKCQLLPKHILKDASDVITYSYKGQSLEHTIKQANIGAGLGIDWTSASHDSDVYDSSALGSSNGGTFPIPTPSDSDPGLVNEPVIFEATPAMISEGNAGQLIIQVSGADPDYGGCEVFLSTDGSNYTSLGDMREGVTGLLLSDFPSGSDPDASDTLSVDITESNVGLDTASRATADAFTNPCYVGVNASPATNAFELVCPTVASETSSGLYDLTDYIRRGVLASIAQDHPTGSRFADLNGAMKLNFSSAWIGLTLHFKFAAYNKSHVHPTHQQASDLSDCVDYTYTPTGTAGDTGDFYIN